LSFLSALILTAAVGANAAAAPTNNELRIGITQEFENLNPMIATMVATVYMEGLVSRSMTVLTPDTNKWVVQLAKKIPTIENGGAKFVTVDGHKGLQVTWDIIDNAKWGDGKDITCEDIDFAWKIGLNPNVSIGAREPFENIKSITWDKKTPRRCVVIYKQAKFDYYQSMLSPMPKHIEQKVLDQYGSKHVGYDQNSEYTKNPTNPGLYNGPYIVSEIKLGDHVTFVPNKYFYGPQPHIKKIVFKLIPNTATLEANLRSGTIDMVSPLGFDLDQALAFEKRVKADNLPYNVIYKDGSSYEHIDLDLTNPILKDLKVRQALVYAINRDEISKALFEGKIKPALHFISPNDPWFTADPKEIKIYPYSKREASRLLDEAGWKTGPDGYRTKNGQKLSLQFMTTAGNKTRETVQTLLQAQWKSVGVDVSIKNEPARIYFSETLRKRKFGGLAMYAWESNPEQTPRSTLTTAMIPTAKNSWSGQNQMAWSNKKVDKLTDELEKEFNAKKRAVLAHEICKEYTEDVPVIPLYYRLMISVIPKNLTGYHLAGHQYYETNEAENWDLK
jgi:peptide/nickel transport system substrate-binding protein